MNVNLIEIESGKENQLESQRLGLWRTLLLVAALVLLVLGATFGLSMLRTASLVYGMSPLRPPILIRAYSRIFNYSPVRTDFWIQARSGPIQIRMLTPKEVPNAPIIILVHGFAATGNKDVGMNAFALRLSQLGFRVVFPNIVSEEKLRMSVTAIDDVDDVVRWSAVTSRQKVSLIGVSFSGGLVIAAAAVPEYTDYIKLTLCIAGYNSIDRLGRYYLHDDVRGPDRQPYRDRPLPGALAPMALQYLDELVSPDNIEPLSRALQATIRSASPAQTLHLTAQQSELLDDVLNVKTEQMRSRYHALLERHRAELAAISPEGKIAAIHGSLYILNGYQDSVIPRGEAQWTRQEASSKPDAKILITSWMHHAVLDTHTPFREKLRVNFFMSHVLDKAHRRSPLPASKE